MCVCPHDFRPLLCARRQYKAVFPIRICILYTTMFRRAPVRQPIGSRGLNKKNKTNVPIYYYYIMSLTKSKALHTVANTI